jgi:hypothetical protein
VNAKVGGSYPPKCPQNGSRDHGTLTDWSDVDFWPGDTFTMSQTGQRWRKGSDGTWTQLPPAAKTNAA